MEQLKIEYVDKSELKMYANNAKIHTPEQVEQIKQSIREVGFNDPIAVWHDNEIIEGHGRLFAVMQMDEVQEVPIIRLDELTDEQRKAYMLIHNKLTMNTDFDDELLDVELDDITDIDMSLFGFDFDDEDEPQEIVEDSLPEEVETLCKDGDLWILGEHQLICGDSTDATVIDRLMDGVKADMVFTDPPYGVSANGGRGDTKKKLKMQYIANDDLREDDLCNFLQSSFSIMPIKEGASIYICYPWATQAEFTQAIKKCGYTIQNCIIWRKNVFGLNGFKGYRPQYEMIYFCSKSDYQWYGDLAQSNVWDFNRSTEHIGGHPTVKPIELIAKALHNSSKKEDIVLDVFGGSGSTLIACEQLNRKCFMCELDTHYCDVIIQRYINYKGNADDVVLIRSGKEIPYGDIK